VPACFFYARARHISLSPSLHLECQTLSAFSKLVTFASLVYIQGCEELWLLDPMQAQQRLAMQRTNAGAIAKPWGVKMQRPVALLRANAVCRRPVSVVASTGFARPTGEVGDGIGYV